MLIINRASFAQNLIDLLDIIYLILLSGALAFKFVGVVKIKNENKR
ncbi:MAG: hypothetical protein ACLU8V_04910 [Oscillospiraceae bacterium]